MCPQSPRTRWTGNELLVVFHLYCALQFGQLHARNKQIIALAELMNRTPSSVAMKAVNFAGLDPALDRRGLANASRADRELWARFLADSESVADQAEQAWERLWAGVKPEQVPEQDFDFVVPSGETERVTIAKGRRVQGFFRRAVLVSYASQCALTGLNFKTMLIASHIIPWSENASRRADPTNGICLNVLHDRAFDKGLVTFDDDLRLVMSATLREVTTNEFHREAFTRFEGKPLKMPERFRPDPVALAYHRENCFKG